MYICGVGNVPFWRAEACLPLNEQARVLTVVDSHLTILDCLSSGVRRHGALCFSQGIGPVGYSHI